MVFIDFCGKEIHYGSEKSTANDTRRIFFLTERRILSILEISQPVRRRISHVNMVSASA